MIGSSSSGRGSCGTRTHSGDECRGVQQPERPKAGLPHRQIIYERALRATFKILVGNAGVRACMIAGLGPGECTLQSCEFAPTRALTEPMLVSSPRERDQTES